MNNSRNNTVSRLFLWISVIFIGITIAFSIGTAFARYQSDRMDSDFGIIGSGGGIFLYAANDDDSYMPLGKWQKSDDGYKLDFVISNSESPENYCGIDQNVSIIVFCGEGLENSDDLIITLDTGSDIYTAVPEKIAEGSAAYNSYGNGYLYRFYDVSSNELSFVLPGNMLSNRRMTLGVSGTVNYPTLIRMIASGR